MTELDDKIILFPSEKEFKIEFLIDEEVSMRGSDKNIHWTIDHNFGTAIVRARTREQARGHDRDQLALLGVEYDRERLVRAGPAVPNKRARQQR